MSSKDRQIAGLERRLKAERQNHRAAINAKTRELEALRNTWELFATYPALGNLLSWLYKLHDAATPLRSPTGDRRSTDAPTHAETGIYPSHIRSKVKRVNQKLEDLTDYLTDQLGPRGPLDDSDLRQGGVDRNQCWNPACPAAGWFQPFDQDNCRSCGDGFGSHRPFDDKTKPEARCWKRGCEAYGKTNQCSHSWVKMGEQG